MQILKARFRGREDFMEAYQPDGTTGALFVATTTPLDADENVIVELVCDGLPNKVLFRGTVLAWRPALPRLRVRAGATVAFAPDEEEKRRFILSTLSGELKPTRRRHTRIPVAVPVRFRLPGSADMRAGDLTEISVGGALLRAPRVAELGTEVVLEILPPGGAAPMPITGRVAYHVPAGTGLKFIYRDGGGSRRIRELIRRIRAA
ncbi:MAG TPA: PilZ domain-containing protein [Polyangia bacterium]|nr:PilZ domain-containing protein [Polyangia bacterium]